MRRVAHGRRGRSTDDRRPGASDYFLGSAVVYTAEAKRTVLGVSQETIAGPGVVSEECARDGRGGAPCFGAGIGLALTGAAGPDPHGGAQPGTVCIALDADGVRHARGFRGAGGTVPRPALGGTGGTQTWSAGTSKACRCRASDL